MKMRNGFVSNSSSSSFVILASKEVFDNTLSNISKIQKDIITEFITEEDFLGRKVNIYSFCDGNDTLYYEVRNILKRRDDSLGVNVGEDEIDSEIESLLSFVTEEFVNLLEKEAEKLNQNLLTHSVDL